MSPEPRFVHTPDGNLTMIVAGDRSLLIDCPFPDMATRLAGLHLPIPDAILHTQVQEEHCREWASLPRVPVHVAADCREIALRSNRFFADCDTRWPLDRAWDPDTRGTEPYTIAGCIIERPPVQPLNLRTPLTPGSRFHWNGIELEILALPGSGKRSIGFYWRDRNILFSGDLVRAGGYLVNFYDLERGYGLDTGHRECLRSLQTVLQLKPQQLFPSSGPGISDPLTDCTQLKDRMASLLTFSRVAQHPPPPPPLRDFAIWREYVEGLYQCNQNGGMIVYVRPDGNALCVDPDICVWKDWETNCRTVHDALDALEKHAGLKRIEVALVTHYHGDHMEYASLLRDRYGTKVIATPDVALPMARPRDFPYVAHLVWFNFPFDHFEVDGIVAYNEPFPWHDVSITAIHTPGHCYAHAAFHIPWKGLQTVCSGDLLHYNSGDIGPFLSVLYNDIGWPDRGAAASFERLQKLRPDLVMSGHGNYFRDPEGIILNDWKTAALQGYAKAAALVPAGELCQAMTPPGYDAMRRRLEVEGPRAFPRWLGLP